MSMGPVCYDLPIAWPAATPVYSSGQRGIRQRAPSKPAAGLPCCGVQQLYAGWKTLESQLGSLPLPARVRVGAKGQLGEYNPSQGPLGMWVRSRSGKGGTPGQPQTKCPVSMERGGPCPNHQDLAAEEVLGSGRPLSGGRGSWQRSRPCLLRGLELHSAMTSGISMEGHGWGQMFLLEG